MRINLVDDENDAAADDEEKPKHSVMIKNINMSAPSASIVLL